MKKERKKKPEKTKLDAFIHLGGSKVWFQVFRDKFKD